MKYQLAKPFLFLIAFILIVGLACGLPTASEDVPAPSAPPTTTPIPQPTAIPEPVEPPTPVAQRFFTEEFDGDLNNWEGLLMSGDEDDVTVKAENGYLIFDIQGPNVYAYRIYEPQEYDNVQVDVRTNNRGYNTNEVSLICRLNSDEGWYEFSISNGGLYNIYVYDIAGDTGYQRLTNGGVQNIHTGKNTNEYGISCDGNELTLYVNGKKITSITDSKYSLREGLVGVSVSSFDVYPINVEYEWVRISQP